MDITNIPETTQRFDERQMQDLFLYLIRFPDLLSEAREHIESSAHMYQNEAIWALLWNALLVTQDKYNVVTIRSLEAEVALLADVSRFTNQDEIDMLLESGDADQLGVIAWCFDAEVTDDDMPYAQTLLQIFLTERAVSDQLLKYSQQLGDRVPVNTSEFLNMLQATEEKVAAIGTSPIENSAFPEDYAQEPKRYMKIGVPYFDDYTKGQVQEEVYGFLGPWKSVKTTSAVKMGVSIAKKYKILHTRALEEARSNNEPVEGIKREVVLHFTYEDPAEVLKHRVWQNVARIHVDSMRSIRKISDFSTVGNLKDYERKLFDKELKNNNKVDGEIERLRRANNWLSAHHYIIDMSGTYPGVGNGGVNEIAAICARFVRDNNDCKIGAFVLDYVGICVRRFLRSRNINPDNMRHYIGPFPDEIITEVNRRFGCAAYLFHQLNTDSNKKKPGTIVGVAQAAEAGNFAENCHFCFVSSLKDERTNVVRVNCGAARREANNEGAKTLKILGDFQDIVDASGEYIFDETQQMIVSVADANSLGAQGKATNMPINQPAHRPSLDSAAVVNVPDNT